MLHLLETTDSLQRPHHDQTYLPMCSMLATLPFMSQDDEVLIMNTLWYKAHYSYELNSASSRIWSQDLMIWNQECLHRAIQIQKSLISADFIHRTVIALTKRHIYSRSFGSGINSLPIPEDRFSHHMTPFSHDCTKNILCVLHYIWTIL